MGAAVAPEATKLDLVKRAAIGALDLLEPDDEIGLWIFSTALPDGGRYRELVPVSKVGQRKGDLLAAIGQLAPVPGGRTPLYATARASVQVLGGSIDPTRVNAVVLLTDGHNEDPADDDRTRLLSELRSQKEDQLVRLFTIGYGVDADAETLRLIAQASRGTYLPAAPGAIDLVLRRVIASF
jgi:Ca-activated chloride channel family protein